jgi:hypothetical protein
VRLRGALTRAMSYIRDARHEKREHAGEKFNRSFARVRVRRASSRASSAPVVRVAVCRRSRAERNDLGPNVYSCDVL